MELWQLRYFIAVAEEEHVGRAAERLHVSQSPLSRQIRQLEAHLGTDLFVREGRGLRLTAVGRDALHKARALIHSADVLQGYLRSAGRGEAGPVNVGYVQGASYNGVMPRALARLRRTFPGIEPRLRAMSSRKQFAALSDQQIDVGFAHYGASGTPGISSQLLVTEPFVVALKARDDLPDELDPEALASMTWITMPRDANPKFHEYFTKAAKSLGFTPRIAIETVDVAAALSFVACGLGAAVIQESIGHSLPAGVVMRKAPALSMKIETHALWHTHDTSLSARHLLDCIDVAVRRQDLADRLS